MKHRITRLILASTLAVLLLAGLLAGLTWQGGAVAAPPLPSGTVQGVASYVFYPSTALTGTTTVYSASPTFPNTAGSFRHTAYWHKADVFVSATSTAQVVTVTAQTSPDGTVWADAAYDAPLTTNAVALVSVIRSGVVTNTTTATGTPAMTNVPYRVALTGTTTGQFSMLLSGEYLRFKIEHSGSVTPAVYVTLRND